MPTVRVALVQFDAVPEATEANRQKMRAFVAEACGRDARWVMFHEGTVCDYTARLDELAEPVLGGPTTQLMAALARENDCLISFGLSEVDAGRYYIAQVFVGPQGLLHCYRKTWLWREPEDVGYRNEWHRYDPGVGPTAFDLDGLRATCFICADGVAPRCVDRAAMLKPQVVFYPNNRRKLSEHDEFGAMSRQIGAPMLVTNRTGTSWEYECFGGCAVYAADGALLASANRDGRKEVLIHDLEL